MEYVTVEGVEIISAGMAWHGRDDYYVTAEHIADVVAAQDDPLVRSPRVKLGHWDRWFGALAGSHDPTLDACDGMPGFGTVVNLRTTEGGAKLVGDFVEVPDWLADAMASAYPTRSAEWVWDWETAGGHKYLAVLTDVSLGSWRPAAEDLADITREQATAGLRALLTGGPEAAAAAIANTTEEAPMARSKQSAAPAASVSQDRIIAAFEKWAWDEIDDDDQITGDPPPGDWYWAWCRDIRLDPDEIIASVDGDTFIVPFSTDGEYAVTIGTPEPARDAGYIPLRATAAAAASAAQARHGQRVLACNLPKPQRPPKPAADAAKPAVSTPKAASRPNERTPMDENVRKALAAAHGLDPDTATEEQVNAAVLAPKADEVPEPEPTAPAADAPETPKLTAVPEPEGEETPEAPPEPVAEAPDPFVAEQSRQLAAATARVAALEAKETERETADRMARLDAKADALVASGQIPPADHAHYRGLYDVDETKTDALCATLAPGRIPVPKAAAAASATSAEEALYLASCARMGHTPTTTKAA